MSRPPEALSEAELDEISILEAKLGACVGAEAGPFFGWDGVNRAMIRHWCEAMGDQNPAYSDPAVAANLGASKDAVIAPPTMMQAWTMTGFGGQHPPGSDTREQNPAMAHFAEHDYLAVVATNCEQEYIQPICEGDKLSGYSTIESVSERKTTALGVGYFVTQLTEYRNQHDEVVGTMRFRILKYKPLLPL
ncbi:MAG: MaoC family dehydratase N-terminal domain-containing protein [Halioglobus sp.]|nr:MaoC family dehydratase N-terminal domain-containing protein [Halioglobus sp.]